MNKIILKEVEEGTCRWFCESCGKKIFPVSETIFSKPLIDSCPHCGTVFDDYELCEQRKLFNTELHKIIRDMEGGSK